MLLGPGEEWKREWLRDIWGRERIKCIAKGDKAGNLRVPAPHRVSASVFLVRKL